MSKNLRKIVLTGVGIIMAIAMVITIYIIGFETGYKTVSKDIINAYEDGLKDASSAIASMYQFYPDELSNPEGNVVTKVIVYDKLNIVRILWLKNREGKLDYGLATTYDRLPTK